MPVDRLVSDATLAFYDQHLKSDPDASSRFQDLVQAAGTEVLKFEPSA